MSDNNTSDMSASVSQESSAPKKRKKGCRRVLLVFGCIIAGLITLGAIMGGQGANLQNKYESYLQDHSTLVYNLLGYKGAFETWNSEDIGNDVNVLLSGGKLYSRNGITIIPRTESEYSIISDSPEPIIINANISYINVVDDSIYCRDDSTREIVRWDKGGNKERTLVSGKCGEVFITNNRIYYIELTNGHLSSRNIHGQDYKEEYPHPVESFVVCGRDALLLNNHGQLGIHHLDSGSPDDFHPIASGIERFFMSKKLLVESDKSLIEIDSTDDKYTNLYNSSRQDFRLVGISGQSILFQEDNKLHTLSNGKKKELVEAKHAVFLSFLKMIDGTERVIAISDSEDTNARSELITLD